MICAKTHTVDQSPVFDYRNVVVWKWLCLFPGMMTGQGGRTFITAFSFNSYNLQMKMYFIALQATQKDKNNCSLKIGLSGAVKCCVE